MAAKTDLTFAEVNTAAGASIFVYEGETNKITLDINALTGDTFDTGLTQTGVLEAVYKLINNCKKAQDTANESLDPGELLGTFNSPSFGVINSSGRVQVTTSQDFFLELSASSVVGENI